MAAVSVLALTAVVGWGVWSLPPYSNRMHDLVFSRLPQSGVENPVTAVLLSFRGYDTLLEIAVLWFLAGIYAQSYLVDDPRRSRFFGFFLLSMSGNFGLIISQDVVSFYVFFALMSFASYGLVIHSGNPKAIEAGRIYIILVVVGELMLFTAFIRQFSVVESLQTVNFSDVRPNRMIVGLILIGFGIKAGALPLHVWLPLAHPAAPTPASAVLSGAMIKAGLLGWLRFLPIGHFAMPQGGMFCIIAGLLAAFYGVAVGLTQSNPKSVLPYSSISQMGLMKVGVGLAVSDAIQPISLWQSLWPVAAGILISVFVWRKAIGAKWSLKHGVPQGDILVAFSYLYCRVVGSGSGAVQHLRQRMLAGLNNVQIQGPPPQLIRKLAVRIENRLTNWQTACLVFVLLTGSLLALALV